MRLRSRTPPGVRELKRATPEQFVELFRGRTPPGVRELKPYTLIVIEIQSLSHPSRGA